MVTRGSGVLRTRALAEENTDCFSALRTSIIVTIIIMVVVEGRGSF